jgi:uncharacterized protein (TIGR02452 family)
MNRHERERIARETVEIVDRGHYQHPEAGRIDIADAVDDAREGTVEYPFDADIPRPSAHDGETTIEVDNETTLSAARRLTERGFDVAALNFASAYHPGGGFLDGAGAQEESLARSSALYACIRDREMYEYHRANRDPMYTSWMIYSPGVPVIRTDGGELLADPYHVAFVTAPAPNAGVVLERAPSREDEVREGMAERIDKVLAICAEHAHDALVLGAWGCGVFGNDPNRVAPQFEEALSTDYAGVFEHVAFAVLDPTPDRRYVEPFERLATDD